MRRLIVLFLLLLGGGTPIFAQSDVVGNLTTSGTSTSFTATSGLCVNTVTNTGGIGINLDGTWSGTVSFYGGVSTNPLKSINANPSNSTTPVSTATGNGAWSLNPSGYSRVCVIFTTASSGTVVATLHPAIASARASGGGAAGGGTVGCTTSGGVAYENGTNNTLTCGANLTYSVANQTLGVAGAATNPAIDINQNSTVTAAGVASIRGVGIGNCDGFGDACLLNLQAENNNTEQLILTNKAATNQAADINMGANGILELSAYDTMGVHVPFVEVDGTTGSVTIGTNTGSTDTTFLANGNVTFPGKITVTGVNGTLYASGFSGSDRFAQINTALATFSANQCGTVIADFTAAQTISTPLVIPTGCTVLFPIAQYTVSTPQYTVAASGASPKGATENAGATQATICTTAPNNYVANQVVTISGVTNSAFNKVGPIISTTSSSCFVVANIVAAANATSGSGLSQQPAITVSQGSSLIGSGTSTDNDATIFTAASGFAADVVDGISNDQGTSPLDSWHSGTMHNFLVNGLNSLDGGSNTVGNCVGVFSPGEAMNVTQIIVNGCGNDGYFISGDTDGSGTFDGLSSFNNANGCAYDFYQVYAEMHIGSIGSDNNKKTLCFVPAPASGNFTINIAKMKDNAGSTSFDNPAMITINGGQANISGGAVFLSIDNMLVNITGAHTDMIQWTYTSGGTSYPQIKLGQIYAGTSFTNIYTDVTNTWSVPFTSVVPTSSTGAGMGWEYGGNNAEPVKSNLVVYQDTKALSNGLNSNVLLGADGTGTAGFLRITGPSAAFSVGGFQAGNCCSYVIQSGRLLTIQNTTSQAMTIVNEDASSTAANRITTESGVNVLLLSKGVATFQYSGTDSRWQLLSWNPGTTVAIGCIATCAWSPMYLIPINLTGSSTAAVAGANQPILYRFNKSTVDTATNIAYWINTGVNGSTGDYGVYGNCTTTCSLLYHTGSIATAIANAGAAVSVAITAVTTAPGAYYFGACDTSTSVLFQAHGTNSNEVNVLQASTAHIWGNDATDTCTTGVLPATITITNITNSTTLNMPIVTLSN